MAALSIRELARKMNDSVMKDPSIDKEAFIRRARVCGQNDPNYPEGTIVFETVGNNSTLENLDGSIHELSVYPDWIGQLN